MPYYRVTCKHAHHGKKKYIPITFSFLASDAIKAMDLAKAMPGVKHSQTILSCHEISQAEYLKDRMRSAYEPFYQGKKQKGR